MSRLRKLTAVTKLFIAGLWIGCSKSEFGIVIVAGKLRQLHGRRTSFRRSLSLCGLGLVGGVGG